MKSFPGMKRVRGLQLYSEKNYLSQSSPSPLAASASRDPITSPALTFTLASSSPSFSLKRFLSLLFSAVSTSYFMISPLPLQSTDQMFYQTGSRRAAHSCEGEVIRLNHCFPHDSPRSPFHFCLPPTHVIAPDLSCSRSLSTKPCSFSHYKSRTHVTFLQPQCFPQHAVPQTGKHLFFFSLVETDSLFTRPERSASNLWHE